MNREPSQEMNPLETLFTSRWLMLQRRGSWEFVCRPQSNHAVGILALTPEREVILIEQFRVPMQARVIEIPAGIVGDEPEWIGESLADTARRELLEETGFAAARIDHLLSSPTSAGMSSELTHLFHASELTRVHAGGGTASEDITTHLVPLSQLRAFFAQQTARGCLIDSKIHAALAAAGLAFS